MEQDDITVSGRLYVSSRRAAEISGYNKDYIGQLSRKGKLRHIMLGRDRFIDEESLKYYLSNAKTAYRVEPVPPVRETGGLRNIKVLTGALSVLIILFSVHTFLSNGVPRLAEKENSSSALEASVIRPVSNFLNLVDQKYLGMLERVNNKILSLWRSARVEFLALFESIVNQVDTKIRVVTESRKESSSQDVAGPETLVTDAGNESVTSTDLPANRAIVVRQSSGDTGSDDSLVNSIRKSFSDEVDVSFRSNGGSGLIRPIFRHPTDQSYVFVLVPLKQQ